MNRQAISFCLTITLLFSSVVTLAKVESASWPDTAKSMSPKFAAGDTARRENVQAPDSLKAANPPRGLWYYIKLVSELDGLWGLLALLGGIIGGVWAFWKSKRRRKPKEAIDTRPAKQRYLECLIAAHQNLPVAGFETNLRVPIPLEKVYVTLQARMAEIDRARDGRHEWHPDLREAQFERNVTVQEALLAGAQRHFQRRGRDLLFPPFEFSGVSHRRANSQHARFQHAREKF